MMSKIAGLFGLAIATLLGSPGACMATSNPPSPPLGCIAVGDPQWEDVWHVCPAGKICWRWNGYAGLAIADGWVNCYSSDAAGDPPKDPCTNEGNGQLTCDGRVVTCTETACR